MSTQITLAMAGSTYCFRYTPFESGLLKLAFRHILLWLAPQFVIRDRWSLGPETELRKATVLLYTLFEFGVLVLVCISALRLPRRAACVAVYHDRRFFDVGGIAFSHSNANEHINNRCTRLYFALSIIGMLGRLSSMGSSLLVYDKVLLQLLITTLQ